MGLVSLRWKMGRCSVAPRLRHQRFGTGFDQHEVRLHVVSQRARSKITSPLQHWARTISR